MEVSSHVSVYVSSNLLTFEKNRILGLYLVKYDHDVSNTVSVDIVELILVI